MLEWARSAFIDQLLVDIINNDPLWTREYVLLREFGHRSVFGEECLTEMTELQSRLISLSHLYDIIQQSVAQHNSYGEDNKTEIPEDLKPYPTKLSKWFDKWQGDSGRIRSNSRNQGSKTPSRNNKVTSSRWVDNESDEDAYAAYMAGKRAKAAAKSKE